MQNKIQYKMGIDVGSTTVKIVVLDSNLNILHKSYRRHQASIQQTLVEELETVHKLYPHAEFLINITGSAGMGIGERADITFVQEVVAAVEVVNNLYKDTHTLIDLGGEDAKMVFFAEGRHPDIRMNGSCAGGTGAFIDQMASLMNISVEELGEKALKYDKIYPIASRCGVFAKTDVQNLISRNVPVSDISASILHAVALQSVTTLARGCEIEPKVLCIGGPLTFIPALRRAFRDVLKMKDEDFILPENGEYFPALGSALHNEADAQPTLLTNLITKLAEVTTSNHNDALSALFTDELEYIEWQTNRKVKSLKFKPLGEDKNIKCFLGIDSGSTTTKIVIMDADANIVYRFYGNNEGNPLRRVIDGLRLFYKEAEEKGVEVKFLSSAATGYGEDLIKSALGLDFGIVETIAHLAGAQYVDPKVSFILDIGGQDIKSIFINNGLISNIELNEACSAGCGSFLQNFASNMGMELGEFSRAACLAKYPSDLGSRCTVFMNSKVKQSLRENAGNDDIAAGLAYSVVKNCLYKVLKISNLKMLGDNIVVQGGTFRNDAVYRALELLSNKTVSSTDHPELMGALGAALYSQRMYNKQQAAQQFAGKAALIDVDTINTKELVCKGCTNLCSVLRFRFDNGNVCYAGNKCEKVFFNKNKGRKEGYNAFDRKNEILFAREVNGDNIVKGKTIGIPRVLNMFDNYPFWHTLLSDCGFNVRLSPESTFPLYQKGVGSVMSDNICFPAKLVHGHILALIEQKVDRIFYPIVPKEEKEFGGSSNSFNCPVVSGYPDVIRSSIDPKGRFNIAFDKPVITFSSDKALYKGCYEYLKELGVSKVVFDKAFSRALKVKDSLRGELHDFQRELLNEAVESGEFVFIVAGRPYHTDPLIHQKVGQILSDLGVIVLTDDVFRQPESKGFGKLNIVSQWSYPNRVVQAAMEVAKLPDNVQLVQLNSFGCGPDSFFMDETRDILKAVGKNITVLRIDEIASPGSVRLRLRSLVESLKAIKVSEKKPEKEIAYQGYSVPYKKATDKDKTILVPWLADFLNPFAPALGELLGLKVANLPKSHKASADLGLMYGNNEVCYPSTLVLGDIIYTLMSGQYDVKDIVLAITQTGGQCRATNYIAQIKQGLINAGFNDIPVIALGAGETYQNGESEFTLEWKKIAKIAIPLVLYGDGLQQMHSAITIREKKEGASQEVFDFYIERGIDAVRANNPKILFRLLKEAVEDFNNIPIYDREYSKVGLIGEIFVKYNNYAQAHITEWLRAKNVEVSTPPLLDFLLQFFVNSKVNAEHGISSRSVMEKSITPMLWAYINSKVKKAEKILAKFKFHEASESIFAKAEAASQVLSLSNQFGEGWMIPGEIAHYARKGVNKVVCIQPFGCIANHIVAKGVEKRIKEIYPDMNILYLDIDGGIAEVNIQNRLHFMI